ncbi:MAG: TlpA family protein disulfide reductase [Rubrivivax sp.]|nr:TlpA family protein disulfide reductase [Rubrivivax sp.]
MKLPPPTPALPVQNRGTVTAPHPRRRLLLAAGLCAAGLAGPAAQAATPGEVLVGQSLRDATLRGLNGPARQLASFRGRPLLINVWASWCGPCRDEMASLERLSWSDLAGRMAIIGISTDDYIDKARAYLRQSNASISHFIDHKLELENMLGATHLPLTVLVDANGVVVAKVAGAKAWDGPEARRLIERSLGLGKPPR